jgi:hypothetical protein
MTLLYTPELLLFSVALTQPLPCSECGIYQVSGCYLGICYGKWYWKSQFGKQSRLYVQWEVRRMDLLDLSGHWGVSDGGGVQYLA